MQSKPTSSSTSKVVPKQFDVIFSDAPYDLESSEQVVRLVLENDPVASRRRADFRTFEEDGLLRISGILAAKELRKRAVLVLPETVIIVGKGPRRQPPRQSGPLGGMGKTGVRIRCRRIAPFSGKIRLPGGRHVPTYLQTSDFIRPPRRRDNGKIGNLPAYGSCPQKSALSSARHPCIRKNLQLEVAGFSFADSRSAGGA